MFQAFVERKYTSLYLKQTFIVFVKWTSIYFVYQLTNTLEKQDNMMYKFSPINHVC